MGQIFFDPKQRSASAPQAAAQAPGGAAAEPHRAAAKAQRDKLYWERLHHYISLHSTDGMQLAKRCALRDPEKRGAQAMFAVAQAWEKYPKDYEAFAAQRELAVQQIETELRALGLPSEALSESSEFIRIDRHTGNPDAP